MSVGDVNSTEKGSGARYNTGKAPLSLIPLRILAASYPPSDASDALHELGMFQETGNTDHLEIALATLGLTEGWRECAQVFDYGRKKYAAWNWAKGMAWSIPLECAARHIVFGILAGEDNDPESGLPHRGHVFCNIVMLLQFVRTYPEGDDLPRIFR